MREGGAADGGYPDDLAAEVTLGNGESLLVRPILPEDAERLARMHARLSPKSLYRRFFAPVPRVRPVELQRLVSVDYRDRLALVAMPGPGSAAEDEVIAVARYDRVPQGDSESDLAEPAVIVEDAWQGQGIGTALLRRLAVAAIDRGVTQFAAEVLAENEPMMRVLRKMARGGLEQRLVGGSYLVRARLVPDEQTG